ncbi:MAG: hypothetical protein MUE60_15335 [Candidatus Eisenbacteria bacterium]|nr:hypothetical protein [Candidatus Eisenbacteria bacterium]
MTYQTSLRRRSASTGHTGPDGSRTRFGCGFVMGVAIGLLVVVFYVSRPLVLAGLTMGSGVLCGWLAVRHGDRFWSFLLKWLRWM